MHTLRDKRNVFLLYLVTLGLVTLLWSLAKPSLSFLADFPYIALTQLSGLYAVVLIGINTFLASRLKILERFLGGLDKVYKQHQFTGKIAFSLMLAHPTFLILSSSDIPRAMQIYFISLSDPAINYGKAALLFFVTIIVLTIFVKLPYHIWKRTHQVMIVPIIFTTLHVATVHSDVGRFAPLGLYIFGLLGLSIISYIYKVILYKYIGPKFEHKVEAVAVRGLITEITLSPVSKPLPYEPGQFVFAVFEDKNVSSEEHPFSISSSPTEKNVRLSIKQSGDFTSTLPKLQKGSIVKLYGPYGEFGRKIITSKKEVVMIAGGIGITPFLSTVQYIKDKNLNRNYKLVYSYKNERDNAYKEELIAICEGDMCTNHSDKNGHLTAEKIKELVGPLENKMIFICGPKPMMKALTEQFLKMGIKRRNIVFEDFSLKG